jgi:hypothetical protein
MVHFVGSRVVGLEILLRFSFRKYSVRVVSLLQVGLLTLFSTLVAHAAPGSGAAYSFRIAA